MAIQKKTFEKPRDLLEHLLWDSTPVDQDRYHSTIYRGHANADWELIPTILRPDAVVPLGELQNQSQLVSEEQVYFEFQMLRAFIFACDESGVAVPGDSVKFRSNNLLDREFQKYHNSPDRWPGDELIEAMVLARLHGLPTRLLDWTKNPHIAIYFAASEALRIGWEEGQQLAIFELKLDTNVYLDSVAGQIRFLQVPGSISKNVVAQQGLFTVHPIRERKGEIAATKGLEQYLPSSSCSPLRKLTIPAKECVELYRLCRDNLGYGAARLYPGADGVRKSVIEDQRYQRYLAADARVRGRA